MNKKKEVAIGLLGIYTAVILWVTVLGREMQFHRVAFLQLFHSVSSFLIDIRGHRFPINFLGNILLFVPLGFLIPLVTEEDSWGKIIRIGFSLSLLIEMIQFITLRGCFDVDDIVLNTMGMIVGTGLLKIVRMYRN